MTVHWNGEAQCEVQIPTPLPADMLMNMLLLPCHPVSAGKHDSDKLTVPVPPDAVTAPTPRA
ncbi:hypothetical protein [Serratia sp. (in: enterobacteria)]|uniref:hypothetical protein n=1 Tax=Serratia sp. (in: enterobacteria) TaxID=616 RepID=UPI003989F993